jgi:excinuclease ABC subunit C
MVVIEAANPAALDAALETVPNRPAVFLLWPREGAPYLARTALLRRRLLRLLRQRDKPSRLLNLRDAVARIEYDLTGSGLESSLRMFELAREHFPETYRDIVKLRLPPYVKLVLSNDFPRCQVTTHLTRGKALYYGPFRSRASAEKFESEFLDLFQLRRCQEDLAPSPDHPGCIYGEMGMCVRPCQQVVGPGEYAHEVQRVIDFLSTGGRSLLDVVAASRDQLSEEMDFEQAARQHKRFEKIQEALKFRDELATDVDHLHGVVVTKSADPGAAQLWFVRQGFWHEPQMLRFEPADGKAVSLDQTLRDIAAQIRQVSNSARLRAEYLALFARWYYSSWRDGEWLPFDSIENLPYRKLVHAVSRVAKAEVR